jgi:hypothetical protein
MNRSEVAQLFAYACLFDTRLQADEGKILAWNEALYSDITFEFAKRFVSVHYSNDDKVIAPVYINKAWLRDLEREREAKKTEAYMLEMAEGKKKAATPEQVNFYMNQIRAVLSKGNPDADMETNTGEVAPDL